MDKRLLTVVLVAVLVALVITAIFYQIIVGRKPADADVATKELVVAKADLPMGSVITQENLRLVDFPAQAYPQGGFSDIEAVVDRSVVQPILANEPVNAGRVTEKGAGFGLAPLIPEGMRAVAQGREMAWGKLALATAENLLYLALAAWLVAWVFRLAVRRGLLPKVH